MINSTVIFISIPIAILGIITYVFILRDDRRWILASIPVHLIVFLERSDKIDLQKLIYTGFFFPALLLWFVRKWLRKERIIDGKEELVFILFLLFGFASIFVGDYRDPGTLFRGFREFYIFIPYLFYFPIRDYVSDEKKLNEVVWTLLITCTIGAVYVIYQFKSATSGATHIINVLWGRKNLSEPLYMTAIIILLAMIASKASKRWLTFPLLGVNILALGLTFTRGYWVATALGVVFMIFFLGRGVRGRLVGFLGGALVAMIAGAAVVFPRIFGLLVDVISARASSITLASESLKDRLIESAAVIEGIKESPIIGNGFGSNFTFYEILKGFTETTWYIHNGYLFLFFKLGIVGALMYLYYYFSKLIATIKTARTTKEEKLASILTSFAAILSAMLVVNVTSPQFDDKVPVLIMSVLWGVAAGIGRHKGGTGPAMPNA